MAGRHRKSAQLVLPIGGYLRELRSLMSTPGPSVSVPETFTQRGEEPPAPARYACEFCGYEDDQPVRQCPCCDI